MRARWQPRIAFLEAKWLVPVVTLASLSGVETRGRGERIAASRRGRAMKKLLTLCVALALSWACGGSDHGICSNVVGSGNLVTESRAVTDFAAVEVSAAAHLVVEQTGGESLSVTAEDNVLPLVRSEVRNGRLILGLEPNAGVTITREILFRLTVRDLAEVEASGATRVEMRGVDSAELTLRFSGASSVSARGAVDRAILTLAGASHCEAPELRTRVLTATVSGASYALVRASDFLEANVSGASVLEYLGDPRLGTSVTGGSLVRRVGP
jgi:hypothetical protein